MPLVEMMRRNRDPEEQVPWVLSRFVGFLSKFGLEVRLRLNAKHKRGLATYW